MLNDHSTGRRHLSVSKCAVCVDAVVVLSARSFYRVLLVFCSFKLHFLCLTIAAGVVDKFLWLVYVSALTFWSNLLLLMNHSVAWCSMKRVDSSHVTPCLPSTDSTGVRHWIRVSVTSFRVCAFAGAAAVGASTYAVTAWLIGQLRHWSTTRR